MVRLLKLDGLKFIWFVRLWMRIWIFAGFLSSARALDFNMRFLYPYNIVTNCLTYATVLTKGVDFDSNSTSFIYC